ncbi:hypothetical protein [Rhodopirellula europaea]|nr:hypothetical protein [Rhodopirellula europaea]
MGGLLNFMSDLQVIELNERKKGKVEIPFVSTLQTPTGDLEVSLEGVLAKANATIVVGNPLPHVLLDLENLVDGNRPGSGSVLLRDQESGKIAKTTLLMKSVSDVRVSPDTLHFTRIAGAKKGPLWFGASGLIRFGSIDRENQSDARGAALLVEASIGAKPIEVTLKRLSDGIYRFTVFAEDDLIASASVEDEPVVCWRLMRGGRQHLLEAGFVFEKK